jgi:hypothetical protein
VHIDCVVIRWASEISWLGSGGVPQGDTQTAADAFVNEDRTDPTAMDILLLDNAILNRARSLTNRAGNAKAPVRVNYGDPFWYPLARVVHQFGPHILPIIMVLL